LPTFFLLTVFLPAFFLLAFFLPAFFFVAMNHLRVSPKHFWRKSPLSLLHAALRLRHH
jgi:hypothetical protein